MPDILIRGMEMPTKGYKTIILHSNGRVYEPTSEELIVNKIADATELPPHGDLIDRSELQSTVMQVVTKFPTSNFAAIEHFDLVNALLRGATVVVPAERREGDA